MNDTAQCSKCGYKIELPHADMIQIFYKDHNCDSTKLQEAIQRVRELHYEEDGLCGWCLDLDESNLKWYRPKYPCQTIKALDGIETNKGETIWNHY